MADLADLSGGLKSEPFVEANRSLVGRIDATNHHVLIQRQGEREQGLHQRSADALAAPRRLDMHRVLHRIAIAWPGAPVAKGCEAQDFTALNRHQHGIALLLAGAEPLRSILEGDRDIGVDRGRGVNHLIVDREDSGQVRVLGRSQDHKPARSRLAAVTEVAEPRVRHCSSRLRHPASARSSTRSKSAASPS